MAPNIQLDFDIRETVQPSHSNRNLEHNTEAKNSSFAKELERAMDEKPRSNQTEPVAQDKKDASLAEEKILASHEGRLSSEKEHVADAQVKKNIPKGFVAEELVLNKDSTQNLFPESDLARQGASVPTKENLSFLLENSGFDGLKDFKSSAKERNVQIPIGFENLKLAESVRSNPEEFVVDKDSLARTKKKDSSSVQEELILASLQSQEGGVFTADFVVSGEDVPLEPTDMVKVARLETGTDLDDKITVMDYRTSAENGVTEASLQDGNFTTSVSYGEGSADITFNLASSSENVSAAENSGKAGESRFASMLANQVQNNAADFVKAGSIVLRDGNSGTINLILHPEQLGNVKISLELHDKLVCAQITVASEEAFQAFRESIPALKQAFAESGFQSGGFDLAWSGSGSNGNSPNNSGNFAQQQMFSLARSAYGDMISDDVAEDLFFEQKMYSDSAQIAVNIMA